MTRVFAVLTLYQILFRPDSFDKTLRSSSPYSGWRNKSDSCQVISVYRNRQ